VHFERSWQVGVVLSTLAVGVIGTTRLLGHLHYSVIRKDHKSRRWQADAESFRVVIPQCLLLLRDARKRDDVLTALIEFGVAAQLLSTKLAPVGESKPVWAWQAENVTVKQRNESVRSEYRFISADNVEYVLTFAWTSESGDVSPQADILLQLVCDAVAVALPPATATASHQATVSVSSSVAARVTS
jgi:hypothetical protein